MILGGFPGGSDSKETAYKVEDPGLIPGSGRSHGEENGSTPVFWPGIPWIEVPGRLQSIGSHKVESD